MQARADRDTEMKLPFCYSRLKPPRFDGEAAYWSVIFLGISRYIEAVDTFIVLCHELNIFAE